MTNKRVKTAGYRKMICRYVISSSYRDSAEMFNLSYHRTDTDQEVSFGTIAGDIEQEGKELLDAKISTTKHILAQYGFDPETGLYSGEEFPYQNPVCEEIIFDVEKVQIGLIPGWLNQPTELTPDETISEQNEELSEEQIPDTFLETTNTTSEEQTEYSEPDTEEIRIKQRRRGKRVEISSQEKEKLCCERIRWFNSVTKKIEYGITKNWSIEKDSSEVVYIMLDVVYVNKQSSTRKGNNQCDFDLNQTTDSGDNDPEKRIGHLNIRIEVDNSHYEITSVDTDEAYKELVAFILNNKLWMRYFIFYIDGESMLEENIKKYCGRWNYSVKLDWMHLQHKIYDRLSNALKGPKVPDPRGNVVYYKQKSRKGEIKKQDHIALSRLYSRAMIRILW